ncbi:MAG: hypothetical protein WB947_05650 [Thermoplasmata archaeon]
MTLEELDELGVADALAVEEGAAAAGAVGEELAPSGVAAEVATAVESTMLTTSTRTTAITAPNIILLLSQRPDAFIDDPSISRRTD